VHSDDAYLSDSYQAITLVQNPAELQSLVLALGPREDAIRRGMLLQGQRYEVHRHHPPLVYGRMHTADPEHSIGIAVCETSASITGGKLYAVITYELPHVSARMVALLQTWSQEVLTAPAVATAPVGARQLHSYASQLKS